MARAPRSASPGPAGASPVPPDHQPERTYPVLSPLRHDGQLYAEGDTIALTESAAETLIALGVLGEAAPGEAAP